jgi:biopolymer transport protein ExbD
MLQHQPLLSEPKNSPADGLEVSREGPEINLIPFIDVLLVILIFLMISTTFTQYQELSITLPSVAGENASSSVKEIRIAISKDGKYAINGNVTDTKDLGTKLESLKNQAIQANQADVNSLRVVIAADAKASHQAVMQVLELASLAGLSQIVFATQDTQVSPKKR